MNGTYNVTNGTITLEIDTSLDICPTARLVQKWILGFELGFTFFLNGLVIALVVWKGKRNKMSFFVLNLAISDFGMAVFYALPLFVIRVTDRFYGGIYFCKASMFLSQVAIYSSTYMLVVMSADRLYAIAFPFSATRRGVLYRWVLVSIAWFIAACVGIKDAIISDIEVDDGVEHCTTVYGDKVKLFVTLDAVLNVFLPAVLVTICYSWIVCVVCRRSRPGVAHQTGLQKTPDNTTNVVTRAKIKSVKVMVVVVSVFLMCWGPHTITYLSLVYGAVKPRCYLFILMQLAPLNSIANPIVFLAFNHNTLFEKRRSVQNTNRTSTNVTYNYVSTTRT